MKILDLQTAISQIRDDQFFVELYEADPRQKRLNIWEGGLLKEIAGDGLLQPFVLGTRGVIVNQIETVALLSGITEAQLEEGVRCRPSISALLKEADELEGNLDLNMVAIDF